jgi:hypothetical protein
MVEEGIGSGRPWYAMWFWRSLTLLGVGIALIAFGEVRVIAAGGGPAPFLPDYTLLLPNLAVLSGFLLGLVGAALALVTTCTALLNAVRRRRTLSGRQGGIPRRGNHHTG